MTNREWLAKKETVLKDGLFIYDEFPCFSIMEFNLLQACTRACVFCPVSQKKFYKTVYKEEDIRCLNINLYKRVLLHLTEIGYKGLISFSGFSEPLLHPKLAELIHMSVQITPGAKLQIITNGDLLTKEKLSMMFNSGLHELVVSLYDGPDQVEYFESMRIAAGIPGENILLRRRYYNGEDYGIFFSNRGGLVDTEKFGVPEVSLPLHQACYYPFSYLKIDFNGDVLFCPHNWMKKFVPGNIFNQLPWDVWKGKKMEQIRMELAVNNRSNPACRLCNVDGRKTGKENFLQWKNIRNI